MNKIQAPDVYQVLRVEGETDADLLSNTIRVKKIGVSTPQSGTIYQDDVSALNVSTSMSAAASGYQCVKETDANSGLLAYTPAKVDLSDSDWEIHYLNHFYSMDHARIVDGQYTTQFEQCAIGGSRNKHVYQRMAHTESEVSIDNSQNRRIGSKWGTQVDSGSVSSALSFAAEVGKAAKISGSLPVSTGGSETGSIGAGKCGSIGPQSGNQVNGAWHYTYPGYGTNDFKGNVAHALYEFAQPNKRRFYYYFQVCYQARY
ncbi:hypothetical protein GCM10009606_19820 [Nocardioides aquiterrae]|uniref:Uncharacterized protein n=1 Tax=Nocardioides aquiterrae TaxID=203799 RepID=A0ABP4EWP7_9ACTN